MRLLLSEGKNREKTLLNKLKNRIAKELAITPLNPKEEKTIVIDIKDMMEDLKKSVVQNDKDKANKYDVYLEKLELVLSNIPGKPLERGGSYGTTFKNLEVMMNYPFSTKEYEIYLETQNKTKGVKKYSEEEFSEEIDKILLKDKTLRTILLVNAWNETKWKSGDKASSDMVKTKSRKKLPLFTTSGVANKENLTKLKNNHTDYLTQESVNKAISLATPGIRNYNQRLEWLNQPENDKILKTVIHEIKHVTQFSNKTRLAVLDNMFLDINIPLFNNHDYNASHAPIERQLNNNLSKFFYYSRPIEIDARLKEYRDYLNQLNKTDKQDVGEKVYEYILRKESNFAKQFSVPQKMLQDEELQNKFFLQLFYQIKIDAREIYITTSKFEEAYQTYLNSVKQVNNKIKSDPAFINYLADEQELEQRKKLTKSL